MTTSTIPIFFIGCVQSSEVALKALLDRVEVDIRGVLTLKSSNSNADFVDIGEFAAKAGVPVHYAEETNNDELAAILRATATEIIFTIGWSRLLGDSILSIPRRGVVGFHPAALPQNRGRHPLIWALALGLEQTASTLFLMDEDVDSGPILSQIAVPIRPEDDAQTLYDKVLTLLPEQINEVIDRILIGDLRACSQDHMEATIWRKRSVLDGVIDWRMSAGAVYNLTRALTRPYPGAEFRCGNISAKLWRCEIVRSSVPSNAEPGKILDVDSRGPIIKTGLGIEGGAVRLLETENCPKFVKGEYL
jgi:methionyl-tRNA formyltransferase